MKVTSASPSIVSLVVSSLLATSLQMTSVSAKRCKPKYSSSASAAASSPSSAYGNVSSGSVDTLVSPSVPSSSVTSSSSYSSSSSYAAAPPASASSAPSVAAAYSAPLPSSSSSSNSSTANGGTGSETPLAGALLSPQQMTAFVATSGTKFTLNNRPFYWSGANQYNLFYINTADVDAFFADAVKTKSAVVRTWAFADGKSGTGLYTKNTAANNGMPIYFQDAASGGAQTFNDDAKTGLGRLDYVVESARKHGIKLILCMTNNWDAFGGIDFYVDRFASSQKTHSSFFTDPKVIDAYQNYLKHVMTRKNTLSGQVYAQDPTILGWELVNEARCVGSGQFPVDPNCKPATITAWIDKVSTYIKTSIHPKQLLGTGSEGFFNQDASVPFADSYVANGETGIDFTKNGMLPHIDMLGVHSYMMHWGVPNGTF